MLLHWDQLPLHYGHDREFSIARPKFEAAGRTTFGFLCCRFCPNDYQLARSAGNHAEAKLLGTETWRVHIPTALERWELGDSQIVVTMVINRSPCRDCVQLLMAALNSLQREFPWRCQQNRFILASRGAYEDTAMVARTTRSDLIRLRDVGWELCVLQVGPALSDRGRILLDGLEDIVGRGIVRLR